MGFTEIPHSHMHVATSSFQALYAALKVNSYTLPVLRVMISTIIRVIKAVTSNPPRVVATIMIVDLPSSSANSKTYNYIQYSAVMEQTYTRMIYTSISVSALPVTDGAKSLIAQNHLRAINI